MEEDGVAGDADGVEAGAGGSSSGDHGAQNGGNHGHIIHHICDGHLTTPITPTRTTVGGK